MLLCKHAPYNPVCSQSRAEGGEEEEEGQGEATLSPKRPIYYHGSRSLLPETREGEREFAHPKFAKFEELNLLGGLPPLPPLSFLCELPAAGRLRSDERCENCLRSRTYSRFCLS